MRRGGDVVWPPVADVWPSIFVRRPSSVVSRRRRYFGSALRGRRKKPPRADPRAVPRPSTGADNYFSALIRQRWRLARPEEACRYPYIIISLSACRRVVTHAHSASRRRRQVGVSSSHRQYRHSVARRQPDEYRRQGRTPVRDGRTGV